MGISSSTEKSQGNWGLKNTQCVVFKGVLSVDIQKAHGTWKSRKSRKWFLLSRYGRHQNLVMLAYLIGNEAGKWILAVCPQGKNWVNNQPDCPGQSWSLHMCFVLILIKYSLLLPKEKASAPSPEVYRARVATQCPVFPSRSHMTHGMASYKTKGEHCPLPALPYTQ